MLSCIDLGECQTTIQARSVTITMCFLTTAISICQFSELEQLFVVALAKYYLLLSFSLLTQFEPVPFVNPFNTMAQGLTAK